MSIKLTTSDYDVELEESKFFGEILLPEKWLMDDIFSPDEMFLCQINLEQVYEQVGKTMLKESGILYFFIDYKKRPQAVCRYYDGEVDAYTCFNEDWESDYDVINPWAIDFSLGEGDIAMLCRDENVPEDCIALLKFSADKTEIDFMAGTNNTIYFLISLDDLKKGNYDKTYLKIVKN